MQPRSRAISAAHWALDAGVVFVRGRGDEGAFAFDPEDHGAHRRARQQVEGSGTWGVPSTRVALSLVGRFSQIRDGHRGHPPGWVLAAAALDMSVRASARRWAGVVVSWVSGGG